ncbi:MAG: hypothetical protein B7Y39_09025 [Bdellovibrio sp. 28-41-41]|nr:MAG: hypothetical protein B7Y39_09025 [Bdellovibrio sp. 28-41-41]
MRKSKITAYAIVLLSLLLTCVAYSDTQSKHSIPIKKIICERFYLSDKKVTTLELVEQKLNGSLEEHAVYLRNHFREFNDYELLDLMLYMRQDSARSGVTYQKAILARRILKSTAIAEITPESVYALAVYLAQNSPSSQTFMQKSTLPSENILISYVRKQLIDGSGNEGSKKDILELITKLRPLHFRSHFEG